MNTKSEEAARRACILAKTIVQRLTSYDVIDLKNESYAIEVVCEIIADDKGSVPAEDNLDFSGYKDHPDPTLRAAWWLVTLSFSHDQETFNALQALARECVRSARLKRGDV